MRRIYTIKITNFLAQFYWDNSANLLFLEINIQANAAPVKAIKTPTATGDV
ncbi:hypothetical protein D3C72_2115100 [compost metagenome]